MTKDKKYMYVGLTVLLVTLILSGVTYAVLTWASTKTNIGINTDCFTIDYTKGDNITGKLKLINETDLITSDIKFTIKDGIGLSYANIGIKSTCNIEGYGKIILNITNISDVFVNGDSKGALKYVVLSNTSTSTVSIDSLKDQTFDIVTKGVITSSNSIDILVRQLSNTTSYKYLIVIYVDNALAGNNVMSATFKGNISAEAYQGNINADYTLNRLGYNVDTSKTPDFTTVSGNEGVKYDGNSGNELATSVGDGTNGIYKSEDDFGTTYYFRGAVTNNYVKFGKYNSDLDDFASAGDDMYWRIVRINGDGSIRMIYDGTEAYANGNVNNNSLIGNSAYNTNYQDNGYVGYMYGNFTAPTNCSTSDNVTTCTGGSTSYEEAHANINDSTIKTYIDNWYNTYLSNYSYAIYDTVYCNDRSITPLESFAGMALTGIGKGIENTAYSNLKRNWVDYAPSLKCVNKNDRFTVSNTIGNAKLTNPVGLITLDEAAMAGGVTYDVNNNSYITNTSYYLYNNWWYWTMTPDSAAGGIAYVDYVNRGGVFNNGRVRSNNAVRPVISLSSDAISGGSGTQSDPWIVG